MTITMTTTQPVDRPIEVTVTVEVAESKLRAWSRNGELCARLSHVVADEVEHSTAPYSALDRLEAPTS